MTLRQIIKEELTPEQAENIFDKYVFNKNVTEKQSLENAGKEFVNRRKYTLQASAYNEDLKMSKAEFLRKFSNIANKYKDNKQVAIDLCVELLSDFQDDGKLNKRSKIVPNIP